MAGGLLAASRASAAPSKWLGVDVLQVAGDSAGIRRPGSAMPASASSKGNAYTVHLHGGLYSPFQVNAPSPTLGLRLGRRITSHLQGGLLVDWALERKSLDQPVDGPPGLKPHLILASAEGHLVPAMAFFQVNLTNTRYLVPYVGIAGGYEWLILSANDFRTNETASRTYSNIAWQSWGGMGLQLDSGLRVDFELSYNGASLERDVTDSSGQSFREAVILNGVGAKVGLDILF